MVNHIEHLGYKPIIGMIHLAGENPVRQALNEMQIFIEEGITAALIENYHGSIRDVEATLRQSKDFPIKRGVNILPNEYSQAFTLASAYGADFIQLDHVAGHYQSGTIDDLAYDSWKFAHPNVVVLGGVWPKYYQPVPGSNLEHDLNAAKTRAHAIVVTGQGTGIQTPTEKIQEFRQILGDYPLIIGAGLTPANIQEQLRIADGAIIGSALKINNQTSQPVDRYKVRDIIAAVQDVKF